MLLGARARISLDGLRIALVLLASACDDISARDPGPDGGASHEGGAPTEAGGDTNDDAGLQDAQVARDAATDADAKALTDAREPEDTGPPLVLPEVDATVLPDGGKACYTPPFGSIEISRESVAALDGCHVLQGDLRMGDHFGETKALFPANLRVVEGTLNFFRNEQLTDLSALRNLTSVGRLLIHHNYALETLSGLEGLRSVRGELLISSNTRLRSLAGLSALETVGEEIRFGSNDALPLSELDRLRAQVRIVPTDAGM